MRRLALLLCAIGLAWPMAAHAEEIAALADAPVFTPGEIIVVGRRAPAELTGTIQEIDADDLRALGAATVADALQIAVGLRVDSAPTALSANGKQEMLGSLRGFDPRHVIVLIDGIPVYEPFYHVLDLRQVPVADIAKIQIIKGPTSVLYGPNALGGVINVVTKRGGGPLRGRVEASYGDVDAWTGAGSVRGGAGPFEYFLSPGFAKSNGFRMADDFGETRNEDGGLRRNSDVEDFFVNGKFGYFRGPDGVALSAGHYEFDGGVPFSMEAIEPATLWRKEWKKSNVSLHGEWTPADYFFFRGRAFYTRFYNTITTYTDQTMAAVADGGKAVSTYDNDVVGAHLLPEFLLGRGGSIGLSLLYKLDLASLQDESGGEWRDYGVETYSGGAEYGLSVADFHLTAGGAYHHFRHVRTPQDELGEDNGAADYQLGLAYTPLDWLEVHAAGAHKTAFPDLHSLYSAEGNPDLKPEEAYNVDAGLRLHPVPEFGLVATWFYSAVRNLIGKREFGNEYSYENIDEATITGVENEIDVNVARGLFTIGLGYTYLSTRDERPSRRLEQLDFRPAHTAFADGRLNLPFGTSLAVQYFYVGERKYEEPSKDRTVRSLPEYGLFNARLAHRLSWDERRVAAEFFLQGKNLLDVYYETAPEKAATGRMLSGGVAVDF